MQNESHDFNEFKIENDQNDAQNLTLCSNCNENVPKVLFCLNCGSPLSNSDVNSVIEKPGTTLNIGNNEHEVLEEPQLPEDVKIDPVSVEPNKNKVNEAPVIVNKKPEISEVMDNLLKSISLKLWVVKMLHENRIDEEHFYRLFDCYNYRFNLCMERRDEMLKQALEVDFLERSLNEAKTCIEELEMRKTLGDILDEEYEVKVPAYKWDIDKYEQEILRKKEEKDSIENLTNYMSEEKIVQMKKDSENVYKEIDDLVKIDKIDLKTATFVKESFASIIAFFESLKMTKN